MKQARDVDIALGVAANPGWRVEGAAALANRPQQVSVGIVLCDKKVQIPGRRETYSVDLHRSRECPRDQRVAERVGRTRAIEWSFTGERIPAPQALNAGLINEVAAEGDLAAAPEAWVERLAGGPTLSYADHKRILRTWSKEGIEAADAIMPELASKTMLSEDAQGSLQGAIQAVIEGKPRPAYPFKGR